MKQPRILALRTEHLVALSPDDLGEIVGAAVPTLVTCVTGYSECPLRSVTECIC